jgi:hypothetical protein
MGSPPQADGLPDSLRCQTPDCPNPIAVVITRLEDSEADMLCMSCCMIFWTAVLRQAAENGTLPVLAEPART